MSVTNCFNLILRDKQDMIHLGDHCIFNPPFLYLSTILDHLHTPPRWGAIYLCVFFDTFEALQLLANSWW